MAFERGHDDVDLNLEATELRLGLPGTTTDQQLGKETVPTTSSTPAKCNKRCLTGVNDEENNYNIVSNHEKKSDQGTTAPPSKAQVVGWPPIRSYRKNCLQPKKMEVGAAGVYVKVSMDGAPYLRKIDLQVYKCYPGLLQALEDMFKFKVGEYSEREGYNGSEFAPTYEDKDGDWMLVGDVPWDMFINSCKRLRIMKASEARGLGCAV